MGSVIQALCADKHEREERNYYSPAYIGTTMFAFDWRAVTSY